MKRPEPGKPQKTNTAVIGLGSMGWGMASSCARAGLPTWGFDIDAQRQDEFAREHGQTGTLAAIAPTLDIVIVVVVNGAQMQGILFGEDPLATRLRPGAVVVASPTVTPDFAREMEARLGERGILYLDCPISGGSVKSAQGELTVMAAGTPGAFTAAEPALQAMAERVFRLGDQAGPGSAMKVVNQLLAGVHIAAAAEAMTFGIKQGIDASDILSVISQCAGSSWMFENRGAHIAAGDYQPHSAVEIFVKDLGIVSDIARASRSYTPLASAALQEFLAASGSGLGSEDDSAVAKIYARNSDVKLPGQD